MNTSISKKHAETRRRSRRRSKNEPPWRAFVHWDPDCIRLARVDDSRHPILERPGWFAVLGARLDKKLDLWHDLELLFVGDAFDQTLRSRLGGADKERARCQAALTSGKEAIVMLGTPTNRSRKKRDRPYLDGVLRALIVRGRSKTQRKRAGTYAGESVLVVNEGAHEPFPARVTLQKEIDRPKKSAKAPKTSRRPTAPTAVKTPPAARASGGGRTTSGRFHIAPPGTASRT